VALSAAEIQALAAFVACVRRVLGDASVDFTLFGSRARGEGDEESDLDVLVRVKGLTRAQRRAVQDIAHDVTESHGFSLNPCVARDEDWPTNAPALARQIARDGISVVRLLEVPS
jgi:predicted nucleotidyltransferase